MARNMFIVPVVALLALLALLPLSSAEATEGPNSAQPQVIPMVFRVTCGNSKAGWLKPDCDGRTQYCDDTRILKCGSCERICQPDQSTFQCQKSCKMYLDINEKAARDSYWIKELESMKTRREIEQKEMMVKFDAQTSRSNMLSAGLIVCGVVVVALLFMSIYVVRTIKRAVRYTDIRQPASKESLRNEEEESGIQTGGGNTPESERRIEMIDTQDENAVEIRVEDGAEIQTGDEAPRTWNFVDLTAGSCIRRSSADL